MAPAGEPVRDDGGEQRLDRAQQRDRNRVRQHGLDFRQAEVGQRWGRQQARDAAEARADGCDVKAERGGRRAEHDDDQEPGPVRPDAPQHQNQTSAASATATVAGRTLPAAAHSAPSFGRNSAGSCASWRPNSVLELAHQNDGGDAGREADRHRIGNELDVAAEPQKADRHQDQPRDQRREHQPIIAVPLHHRGDEHDEGARRAADLHAAAAEQRHDETADDRRVEAALRTDAGGDRDRHRQRQRHDGDRQAGERIRAQVREPVALAKDRDELRREQFERGRRTVTDGGGCHGVEQQTEEA